MPVRFMPSGVYEFDTVEEAMQFHALSSKANGRETPKKEGESPPSPKNGPDFAGFFSGLALHQIALLKEIANANDTLTTETLADRIHLKATQVGPMLRHIRSRAERFSINADKLLVSETTRQEPGNRAAKVYTTKYKSEINSHLRN